MKTHITHTVAETQGDRCSVNESSAHHGNTETKAVMLALPPGFGTFLKIKAIKKIPTLMITQVLPHCFLLYSWLSYLGVGL